MKIGKLNLFSDFHFQTENENWKSPSDFRFPFSNQKRKSELWNSTRTLLGAFIIKSVTTKVTAIIALSKKIFTGLKKESLKICIPYFWS